MRRLLLTVLFVTLGRPAVAQWVAPAQIPQPSFGVLENAPPPNLWVNEATGNDSNPGTQAKPRKTIPLVLPAGTVVSITGTYTTSHASPNTLEAHGTAAQPVFLEGGTFTLGGELSGSYAILERSSGPGGWMLLDRRNGMPSDHLVVRHYQSTGGFGIAAYSGGSSSDLVFSDVSVDLGYTNQTEAQGDWHCIGVGKASSRVWILDSRLNNCRGDGVQVNGAAGGQGDTGPVYIGRVTCVHNRQSCAWAKQSHDVVISETSASQMRPDADYTNPGVCFGAQYFAVRFIIVNSHCFNSENGIRIASYDAAAYGTSTPDNTSGFGLFGTHIENIHALGAVKHDPNNPQSPGSAVILVGASRRYLQDNVITDADGGIAVQSGPVESVNNTITNIGSPSTTPAPPPTTPPPPATKPPCSSLSGLAWLVAVLTRACT